MTDDHLNIPEEIWKPIPGFEGYYDVSNQGRVRSYRRRIGKGEKRDSKYMLDSNPQLILKPNPIGAYSLVTLIKGGSRFYHLVHKLVLETFIGPCPPGMEGCHGDGTGTNNFLANLRWDTPSNNCLEKRKHGTALIGERCCNSKLTANDIKQIREMASNGFNHKEIGKIFSVSGSNIGSIVHRRTWNHI